MRAQEASTACYEDSLIHSPCPLQHGKRNAPHKTKAGADDYRSRDYRFLGTIGYFDELYLPLKKGENELIFAVSEDFGGWGIKALFEDPVGIRWK
jgi:hypothetical protein